MALPPALSIAKRKHLPRTYINNSNCREGLQLQTMKPELVRAADFSKLLRQRLAKLQMHPVTFMLALRMQRYSLVRSWLDGTALPSIRRTAEISLVLDLCP